MTCAAPPHILSWQKPRPTAEHGVTWLVRRVCARRRLDEQLSEVQGILQLLHDLDGWCDDLPTDRRSRRVDTAHANEAGAAAARRCATASGTGDRRDAAQQRRERPGEWWHVRRGHRRRR